MQKSGGVAETGELIDAENVDEFTIADISYFSEYGVWLDKRLACFNKFTEVFWCQNLYSNIIICMVVS